MQLRVLSDEQSVLRLEVVGRIVEGSYLPDTDPLDSLLDGRSYQRSVLLSLANTDFIDSSGLALLLVWHKRFCEAGGKLVIHSVPSHVMDTLKVMRMELVLNLAKDEPAAMELVQGADA
jgi:anti-sigma B factor antagonist